MNPLSRRTRRATEKSAFRFLVACRDTPDQPCPAAARPILRRGLPRLASRERGLDSSALQPIDPEADGGAAGPRNGDPFSSAGCAPRAKGL